MRARAGLICAAVLSLCADAARADLAAVTSQNAGQITLIDTAKREILQQIALPGLPAAVAADGLRGRFLAIAVESRSLAVYDQSGAPLGLWPLAGEPFGLAIRKASGTALVAGWDGMLREIDPLTGAELAQWPVGPAASGVDEADGVIVVTNRDADSLSILSEGGARRDVKTGAHPFGVTIHEGLAFVTNVYSDDLSVIELETGTERARIPTGSRPYAVAFAAGKGFVTNQYSASITVFDPVSFAVLGEIETDDYPEGIAASSAGEILVACWFSDSLQIFDAQSLELLETLDMPQGPRAFGRFVMALP